MNSLRRIGLRLERLMFERAPGMITCREFDGFILDYVEGRLAPRERRLFERHTRFCGPCQRYLERYRATDRLVMAARGTLADAPPADAPEELIQAILRARRLATD